MGPSVSDVSEFFRFWTLPPRQPFTPPISTVLCKILEIDERPRPSVRTSFMDGPYVVVYKKIVCF